MTTTATSRKLAAVDQPFEQALSDLAYSQLSSKAPRLFRYAVAFQVLDQNDDRSRAVGVFGFKVGDRWLRVPVFYRNGEIEGTELLMPSSKRSFVPLTDEWVNYFLDGGSPQAGRPIDKSESSQYSAPNLWQLRQPPTKWAADKSGLVTGRLLKTLAQVKFAKWGDGYAAEKAASPTLDLVDTCRDHPDLMVGLGRMCRDYPWFGDALARYHGREKVASALDHVRESRAKEASVLRPAAPIVKGTMRQHTGQPGKLVVVRSRQTVLTGSPALGGFKMKAEERVVFADGRNVYRDDRPDEWVTNVVSWGPEGEGAGVRNPHKGTGVYHVVTDGEDAEPCLVVLGGAGPLGNRPGTAVVVRLSDKAYAVAKTRNVWTKAVEPAAEYAKAVGAFPEANVSSLPKVFLLVAPDGECSAVMEVVGRPPSGAVTADVRVATDPDGFGFPAPAAVGERTRQTDHHRDTRWEHGTPMHPHERWDEVPRYGYNARVAATAAPGRSFYASGGTLFFPKGTRVVDLADSKPLIPCAWENLDDLRGRKREEREKEAGVRGLAVEYVGQSQWRVDGGPAKCASDVEADLVEVFGLRPADAGRLVGAVGPGRGQPRRAEVRVKFAAVLPQTLSHGYPNAPSMDMMGETTSGAGMADDVVPSRLPITGSMAVTDALPHPDAEGGYRAYPSEQGATTPMMGIGNSGDRSGAAGAEPPDPSSDPQLMKSVMDAAQSGRRDLFDTAALSTLLRYTTIDTVLARLLPCLWRTTNEAGATVAHMLWNRDDYEEKFGRTDHGTLVDRVRDLFESSGLLFLKLKEKSPGRFGTETILPDLEPSDDGNTEGGKA